MKVTSSNKLEMNEDEIERNLMKRQNNKCLYLADLSLTTGYRATWLIEQLICCSSSGTNDQMS